MFKTVTIKGKHSAALKSSLVAVEEKHSNSLIVDYLLGLFLGLLYIIIFAGIIDFDLYAASGSVWG